MIPIRAIHPGWWLGDKLPVLSPAGKVMWASGVFHDPRMSSRTLKGLASIYQNSTHLKYRSYLSVACQSGRSNILRTWGIGLRNRNGVYLFFFSISARHDGLNLKRSRCVHSLFCVNKLLVGHIPIGWSSYIPSLHPISLRSLFGGVIGIQCGVINASVSLSVCRRGSASGYTFLPCVSYSLSPPLNVSCILAGVL